MDVNIHDPNTPVQSGSALLGPRYPEADANSLQGTHSSTGFQEGPSYTSEGQEFTI